MLLIDSRGTPLVSLLLPVKTMVAEDQPRASANADPIPEYVALSDVALNKNAGRTVSTTNCSHVASSPASPGAAYESDGSDESHWDSSQAHHIANGLPAIAQPSSIKATDIVNISSVNVLPDKEIYSASASKKRKHVADNESGSKKVVLEMADGAPGPSRTHQKPGKKAATAAEYDAKGVSHQPCAFPGCTTDVPVKNWGRHMKYVFLLAAVATLADFAALSSDRTPEWHHCDWEGCSYQAKRTDNLKTHKQNVHKVPKPAKSGRRVKKTV